MGTSIKKNYLYNLSYQILTLITPFVTTPYLSRVLGADGVGLYSYTSSIVAYFILIAQFGIMTYAQREVAYNQKNMYRISLIFFEVMIFQLVMVLISLILYYIAIFMLLDNWWICCIQAINIIAVFFDISWLFQGMEEFGKIVFRNFVVKILNVSLIFLAVNSHNDLVIYILIMGIMNIVSGLIMWGYLPQYICQVKLSNLHPFRNIKTIIELFLPQIAITVYLVLDKTMIGVFTGSSFENGWYEQAEKMAKMPMVLITSLGIVMLPRIANCFAENNFVYICEYMQKAARFIWFLAVPLSLGLIGISSNFIPWFLGDGYDEVIPLLNIMSGIIVAISFSNLFGFQYMVPTNRQNLFTLTVAIGAVVNVVLNFIFIPLYQSLGAAVATLITEVLVTVSEVLLLRRELPIKRMIFSGTKYWLSGTFMLAIILIVGNNLNPSCLNTLLLITLGSLVYFGILLVFKDIILIKVLNKFISILEK